MKTLFLAAVFAGIALGGVAHATDNSGGCKLVTSGQNKGKYDCGSTYVSNVNSAEAAAAAVATSVANGGAGGSASATGGNATASNGDQVVNVKGAKIPRVTGVVGVTLDITKLMTVRTQNLRDVVETVENAKNCAFAAEIMNGSPALINVWQNTKKTIRCE